MKKRLIIIFLAIATALACAGISGCNLNPTIEPTETPTEPPVTENPTEKPTEQPTELPTEAPAADPTEGPTEGPTEEPEDEPAGVLVYDFEDMPTSGYTFSSCGWDGSGKKLLLNGEQTPYWMGYNAANIEITNDAYRGRKAIHFQMSDINTHTRIYVALSDRQIWALERNGSLSFWYKSSSGVSIKVNGVSFSGSENAWKQIQMTEAMVAMSADAGYIEIELLDAQNDASFWLDDIVAVPGTDRPTDEPVEDNGSGLVFNFENMPMTGYTYDNATGAWDGSGIRMLLHGELTPFSMGYNAESITITADAHTGEKAIRFQKIAEESHSRIYITLTEKQLQTIKNGGGLSFWYKCNGGPIIMVGGVLIGNGKSEWTQVMMTEDMLAHTIRTGNIDIEMHETTEKASFWLDDIVFAPIV